MTRLLSFLVIWSCGSLVAEAEDILLEFESSPQKNPFIQTIFGKPSYPAGISGRSIHLPKDSYLEIPSDFFDSSATLTFMAWIQLDRYAVSGQTPIIVDRNKQNTDFQLVILPSDFSKPHRLMFTVSNASGQLISILSDKEIEKNTWTQIAVVYNGNQIRLFINGSLSGTPLRFSSPIADKSEFTYIGGDIYGNSLVGSLDKVVLTRRTLSDWEVYNHYRSGYGKSPGTVVLYAQTPTGEPLPLVGDLLISDTKGNPIRKLSGGSRMLIVMDLPPERLSFDLSLNIPDFGLLRFTAERGGKGIPIDEKKLDLIYEVARHRLAVIQTILASLSTLSTEIPLSLNQNVRKAQNYLTAADKYPVGSLEKTMYSKESLRYSAPAGEELVIQLARARIHRNNNIKDKLVSSHMTYIDQEGKRMKEAVDPVFNMGLVVWHWALNMPQPDQYKWSLLGNDLDSVVDWLTSRGKFVRGHALVWLSALPKWIEQEYPNNPYPTSFEQAKKKIYSFTKAVVQRYPQIQFWNIANELNNSWSNLGFIQPEQAFELIRGVSNIVEEYNPTAKRGVNIVPTIDDAFNNIASTPRVLAPYPFLRRLIQDNVAFEYIGLQMYFSGRGLLEFDQLLERYGKLGKRIHITELQTSASHTPQSGNRSFPSGVHPAVKFYKWHRTWDAYLQSEWLEGTFLISLSKDFVDEWNWWDVADYDDLYFPWGGLMDENYRARPAYHKLQELIAQ